MQSTTTRSIARCARGLLFLTILCGPTNVHAQSASCTSAQGCATVMLNGMVSSLGGDVEDQLWGWVFGGGQATGTADIVDELDTIEGTLSEISKELGDLEGDIQKLNCGIDVDFLNQYAAGIQSYFQTYQLWVSDMKQNAMPSVADMSEWANCAVGLPTARQTCAIAGGVSVQTMMQALANAAAATAGSSGSIAACVEASGAQPPTLNTLDDRPWYEKNVEPITDWYLGLNTQGLAVLVEAWHFRAWQESGSPTTASPDEIYDTICPAGDQHDGCIEPINYYNNYFFGNVKSQLQAGGAPYSTDQYLIFNNPGWSYLVARSIEAYNQAADPANTAGCASTIPGALTSAAPCGPTVGNYNDPLPSVAFGPYGYGAPASDGTANGTWETSVAGIFQRLFNLGFNSAWNGVTASRFLCTLSVSGGDTTECLQANGGAGLQMGSKIVQFSDLETSSAFVTEYIGHPLIRFMDGGLKNESGDYYSHPMMNNAYQELFVNYGAKCYDGDTWYAYNTYRNDGTNNSSDPDYYKFEICYGGRLVGQDWIVKPQFDPRNPVKQYRWPMLDRATLTCGDGSSAANAFNPAGMPTMCGADFDAWFEAIVPPGPSTTTVSATADTTLHSAAPNGNDGRAFFLSLGGNPQRGKQVRRMVLGFDAEEIDAALAAGEVIGVFLMLTPEPLLPVGASLPRAAEAKGADGIRITAYPLAGDFVEGDGNLAYGDSGTGTGATWNCAEDADPSDNFKECLQLWPNPLFRRRDGVATQQPWAKASPLIWDVTSQVAQGRTGWVLTLDNGGRFSDFEDKLQPLYFSQNPAELLDDPGLQPKQRVVYPQPLYYSREAAELRGDSGLAPQLLVIYKD